MSANSKIEWCDHTFNPWEGCNKVSPGCLHCYAEARDLRFTGGKHWGKGAPRRRTSESNWQQPLKWNREAMEAIDDALHDFGEEKFIHPGRPKVFCCSLADWLDDEVPIEWLADMLKLIHETPNLDWLLLTKRPENWKTRIVEAWGSLKADVGDPFSLWLSRWNAGTAPHNVWIGTTVEDQTRADQRIPALLKIPAKVRFLSCEPLLSAVDLKLDFGRICDIATNNPTPPTIDWVICGGESGHGARPMHPDWARSLRDQCKAAGVAFFFKQWGEWAPLPKGIFPDEAPWCDVPYGEFHNGTDWEPCCLCSAGDGGIYRVGKKVAGRLLDGVEHNEFPKP